MNQLLAAVFFAAAGMMGNVPEDMKQLVDSGQFQKAYQYAQQWQDDYAGVPEYDLYFGIAALEIGQLPEAVMALERVLMVTPSNERARVELARALFLMRDYSAAEQAFHDVLSAKPPAPVQHRIRVFLDSIEARKKSRDYATSLTLEAKAGYSTNVNSATSAATLNDFASGSSLNGIGLSDESRKYESAFADTKLSFNVTRPVNEKRVQYLTVEYQDITNEEIDDFNIDILNLGIGYMANIEGSQVRIPINYQAINIDNEFIQSFASLGFDSVTPIDKNDDWINFAIIGFKRFKDDHVRDTDLMMAGTGWGHLFPGSRLKAVGSIFIGDDDARKNDAQGNTFGGVRGALQYRLNLDHSFYLNALYQESRYHDKGIFAELRKDTTTEGVFGWRWRLGKNIRAIMELSYTDNDSSLTIFSYDRFKSQLGIAYQFN